MKYLIIPDIHTNISRAEDIIKSVPADNVVLLGDYFDEFADDPESICNTADWLKWSLNQPNRVHLIGNHDIHYYFKDNKDVRCSGYEQYKAVAINDILKPEDWKKLKFFHVIDDWFLTHGGIHPYWIDPKKCLNNEEVTIEKESLIEKLEKDSIECLKELSRGRNHWFEVAGWARCNSPFVGGLLWCDFNKEFVPIKGINQIVGHTPSRDEVRWKFLREGSKVPETSVHGAEPFLSKQSSYNVCFDSYPALKWYGIMEENRIKICEYTKI